MSENQIMKYICIGIFVYQIIFTNPLATLIAWLIAGFVFGFLSALITFKLAKATELENSDVDGQYIAKSIAFSMFAIEHCLEGYIMISNFLRMLMTYRQYKAENGL